MSLLAVDIDERLLMDFRRFADAKHGRIYRALKPEVELALRNHLKVEKEISHKKGVRDEF